MKSFLLKVGILSALTVSLFNGTASAKAASVDTTWSSKCSKFGQIKQNINPSFQHINCLLTNAAINADIPPEVVKAIAWQESFGWKQFVDGKPLISDDGGIGIMQVTDGGYDTERLKSDIAYNIEVGVNILNGKYSLKTLPKIKGANRHMIENWYFSVMAYNGIKPVNSPLHQKTGEINNEAYQEEVFRIIEGQSFINETTLARFPFKTEDFDYIPTSNENIKFLKLEYTADSELHQSAYFYKLNEKVLVTGNKVNLRPNPTSTSPSIKKFSNETPVMMNGEVVYDQTSTTNQFVWIPVKTVDGKVKGYVASPYIYKVNPIVSGVTNGQYSRKAVTVRFNEGTATLNGKAFVNGEVVNKAGSYKLIVRDAAGKTTTVTFTIDLTPPVLPTVNKVTSKTIKVTGKAEKYATVEVYKGSTLIGKATSLSTGSFTVKIKAQKKSTILKVFVKDKAGNTSKAQTVKVY